MIDLNHEETEVIRDLLKQRIDFLGPEIHHTRSREYRAELEQERERLIALREKLGHLLAV